MPRKSTGKFRRTARRFMRRAAPNPARRRSSGLNGDTIVRVVAGAAGAAWLLRDPIVRVTNAPPGAGAKLGAAAAALKETPASTYFEAMAPSIAAELAIGAKKVIKRLGARIGASV